MGKTAWNKSKVLSIYRYLVINRPLVTISTLAVLVCIIASYINQFRLDASSDSLLLENDKSLAYYRAIKSIYGSNDYLVISYTPHEELFSSKAISRLQQLHNEIAALEQIDAVTSILNAPLIESPPITLSDIAENTITLQNNNAHIGQAKKEIQNSPLYRNMLISPDGKTTALMAQFKQDDIWYRLLHERNNLRKLGLERKLTNKEKESLSKAELYFKNHNNSLQLQLKKDIATIRTILDKHRDKATIYLGGVPMITADSIDFVRSDLIVFGLSVFALLTLILTIIFNRPRWVVLAMSTCMVAGVTMMGLLGLINWPVTVVSANFISLLLILTLSILVHLIVRYRELLEQNRNASQHDLVLLTITSKFIPCLYTALTSMVAFGSLVVSNIRPIIDFGWMMVFGLSISMIVAFTIFPATLVLLKRETGVRNHNLSLSITRFFADKDKSNGKAIALIFSTITILSIIGISRLTVENRFIDYFKSSTEIYQGMEMIDNQLGGTTPMDIIIDAPSSFFADGQIDEQIYEDDLDLEIEDLFGSEEDEGEAGITGTSYWFNSYTLQQIAEIHDYIDSLDETGKVLSLTTTLRMLEKLDQEILDNNFALALLHKQLPIEMKSLLIDPYLSADGNQLRFSVRVFESDSSLKREELLNKIHHHLTTELGLESEQIKITGMLVLYNNMLQSLFQSQIMTIGVVFIAILFMFIVLFRNLSLAFIALIPNMITATLVLGIMGWANIPLDLMTITIAAICIGIAVDNSIHYIHRFSSEFNITTNYWESIKHTHDTIGCAIYYTTITIALGFSILAFSNFIPTIYFGLLTGFSMIAALIANLTLLPVLIMRFKPLGKQKQ